MRLQIVAWVLLLAGPGLAQGQNAATLEGDIEYGRYLSSECVTCHQVSGADEGIPSIIGWEQDTFVSVLDAYQKRKLPNLVMRNIAANLDKEQIQALAVFFATLPLPE
jgi:cytochrome c